MKKLILAFVALAFAFAISSCCDQSRCPGNMKCRDQGQGFRQGRQQGEERPYRWDHDDTQDQQGSPDRPRRW